ncbi:MAG: nuclear transport factor 2 family protein [Rhodospirillales bacterium]|nr:nuclear transport factor 2 family protein [Rhodospirillales bacterium]
MAKYTTEQLSGRAEISDVLNNYGMSIDFKDYDLLRSCFVDDVAVNFTSLGEGFVFKGGDEWTAKIRDLTEGLDATQHIITNHDHKLDGNPTIFEKGAQRLKKAS